MKAKNIIAILSLVGLLAFVAVSVLGGSKDKVASTRTALTAPENVGQSQVGDRYLVGSPLGTKGVPQQINYQGYLVNSSDTSAITDTLEMTFRIYDAETGGTELWCETHPQVVVGNGLFNVLLGVPNTNFTGQDLWLETTVAGEILSPRKKLVSIPYGFRSEVADHAMEADSAFHAVHSDTAEYALNAAADNDWVVSGDNIYRLTGNVGIGTTSPNAKLHLNGNMDIPFIWALTDNDYSRPIIQTGWESGVGDYIKIKHGGNNTEGNTYGFRISDGSDGSPTFEFGRNDFAIDYLVIDNAGNLGIGTTNPEATLDVNGNIRASSPFLAPDGTVEGAAYRFDSDADVGMYRPAGNTLGLVTGGTERIRIQSDGNVGIGTTNPQGKLDVNGPLAVAGNVGTTGQVLKSQGAGVSPAWGEVDYTLNSDKVDNIHASTTPTANYLYPLDGNAKVPNSRLYTGSGNGLDADMVDGQHASAFVTQGQANSITSGMIINGTITDADISSYANIQPSKVYGTAWTSYNDGSASGLDADKLDGQQGSYYFHWGATGEDNGVGLTLSSLNSHAFAGFTNAYSSSPDYAAMRGENRNTSSVGALGVYDIGVYGGGSGTYAGKFYGLVDIDGPLDVNSGSSNTGITATSSSYDGVDGITSSSSKAGVVGKNSYYNTWGGCGYRNYGIWGYQGSGAKAGYFDGNVQVTGNLTKGSGSFKIDHPLDPPNKYLYHSFVESPDMMNVYNGNVLLDANGEAVVELPNYFEALNKDFRYQLTAIGAPGANLYIAEIIASSRFKIAGGQPGMEVSWQVTGIRKDPFAEANRIQVEIDKPVEERGRYLHPEVYGLGPEYGIDNGQDRRVER